MALLSKARLVQRIRRSKEARTQLVASNVAKTIAYQIRTTREKSGLSQQQFAQLVGMTQNNLSRLENPDYGRQTISSLKRIAEAFDVALVVRMVPFSQYIDWVSGTPHLDTGLRPEALAVQSFSEEEEQEKFDSKVRYFACNASPTPTTLITATFPINSHEMGLVSAGSASPLCTFYPTEIKEVA